MARRTPPPEKIITDTVADHVSVVVPLDPYLSLKALSKYAGLSRTKLDEYINRLPRDLALPCYRPPGGGKILVRRSEFDAWIEAYRTVGRAAVEAALRKIGLLREQYEGRADSPPSRR